jgi:hypothetical protein
VIRLSVILAVSVGVVLWECRADLTSERANDWLLVPGERAGSIGNRTSEQRLRELFGAENVVRQVIFLGDGGEEPGTVLFPDDPLRRVEIFWRDQPTRLSPRTLRIAGNKTRWRLQNGITLRTTLTELEKLNGRSFEIAGWGWDFGGVVCTWNDGVLEGVFRQMGGAALYAASISQELTGDEEHSLIGETCRPSSLPLLHKINPAIEFLWIEFAESVKP